TFSATVRQGNSANSWNTTPRSGPGPSTGRPSTRSSPAVTGSKPPTMCRNVLLPQPDGPTTVTNSPSPTTRLNPRTASTLRPSRLKVLTRSRTAMTGPAAAVSFVTLSETAKDRPDS